MLNTPQYNVVLMTYREKYSMPLMFGYIHAVNQIQATIYDFPKHNFHCLLALKVALCHNKYTVRNRNGKSQNTRFEEHTCYV